MEIAAGQFKSQCLKLMDEVQRSREEIVITKHGRPVAKLVPVEENPPKSILGYMGDSVEFVGDILSPIDEVWTADEANI